MCLLVCCTPESTTTTRSSVFWEAPVLLSPQENEWNVALSSALSFNIVFSPNPMPLGGRSLFVRFPHRTRISLMKFTFLDNVSRWPFFFHENLNFVPGASCKFVACPAETFNLVCPIFRWLDFFGCKLWNSQPWALFLWNRNSSLSFFFFDLARWNPCFHQVVDTNNYCHGCTQTCNNDIREDVDNHTKIF